MYQDNFAQLLALLIFAHFLADYPLQGDFLAQAKDRHSALGKLFWPHALAAHSVIHGGFVMLITGSLGLGIAETLVHALTDKAKCDKAINLHTDQAIHILCKVAWAAITVYM